MPIKIPKGILGRRASGNTPLEELRNPPEPSFRVIERPQDNKSFDGGVALKRMSHGRSTSPDRFTEDHLLVASSPNLNNRGSGGTNNSRSSGGNDNSSTSARFSSTSTLPSSTDLPLDDKPPAISKDRFDMPAPPPVPESSSGRSLRAAGRAFSFGRKKADASQTTPRPSVENASPDGSSLHMRNRALTESSYASGSTATPPKLFEADLNLGISDEGFGSMFENFGKRASQITLLDQGTLGALRTQSPEHMSTGTPRSGERSASGMTPAPLNINQSRGAELSSAPHLSHDSHAGLENSTSPMERTFSYENDSASPRVGKGPPKARNVPVSSPPSLSQRRTQQRTPSGGLAKSSAYGPKRVSNGDGLDADARLVMDSINASRNLERYTSANYSDDDENPAAPLVSRSTHPSSPYAAQGPSRMPENGQRSPGPMFDSSDRDFTSNGRHQASAETTPRAPKSHLAYQDDSSLFDAPTHAGRQAPVFRPKVAPPAKPQTQNKIMTPAQFEQYRRQQEMTSTAKSRDKDESDDEEDDYEDDDEIERSKLAARQRRKQEAHMSVYRQQMMKMTGEQPADLPNIQLRPGMGRSSMSAPALGETSMIPEFSFEKPSESGKASDDEDEDVPLGVLAAHGFPSKNRPPTATGNAASRVQFKSESYPPPPASVSGGAGNRGSALPAFARHLPPDPYFGAGLVNPSNRESLALGQGAPRSVQGNSRMSSASPVPGPPGGLVGVINAEERARAARRGSPSPGGMPLPPSMGWQPPMMTHEEQATHQATAQMSEQMNQMMQMQMQWMQQMQAMMAGGGMVMPPGQQPPAIPALPGMPPHQQMLMMPPGMAAPPNLGHASQRPLSQGSHSAPMIPMGHPPQQRAMSMMGPRGSAPWPSNMPNRKSTAPSMMSGALELSSIAPSERSNIGQPSRYRPVSIAPADEHRTSSRLSTFADGSLQPGVPAHDNRLSTSIDRSQSRQSNLRAVSTSPQPFRKAASDDDDDEGWAAMKQKTDKKKNMWRLNRKNKATAKEEMEGFEIYKYSDEEQLAG